MVTLSRMERQLLAVLAVLAIIGAALHEVAQLKTLGVAIQEQLMEDYYTVLGIPDTASTQEIKTAYRRATSQFQSRPQDEDARMRRAKVVAAHDTLTDDEARQKYDRRRQFVQLVVSTLTAACIAVPSLGIVLFIIHTLNKTTIKGSYGVDVRSFEGKVMALFGRLEQQVTITLRKDQPDSKLGLRLVPVSSRAGKPALQVAAIAPDSVSSSHNAAKRESRDDLPAWWSSEEVWVGDTVISLNGVSGDHNQMMNEFSTSSTFRITVGRSPSTQALLPWVTEVEVKRTQGERWGLQMANAEDGSQTLDILEVDRDGAVARWNQKNPHLQIWKGDRIAAVNKKLGINKMLSILRDGANLELHWIVMRGVLKSQASPEFHAGPFRKTGGRLLGIKIGKALETPVRGSIVEPLGGERTVLKTIVAGHLVDEWNQNRPADAMKLEEGVVILAVNGKTNHEEFAAELGKPVVHLTTRRPIGASGKTALPEAAAGAVTVACLPADNGYTQTLQQQSQEQASANEPSVTSSFLGLLGSWTPSFLTPAPFKDTVRKRLTTLRCEFTIEVSRTPLIPKIGLKLEPKRDDIGGIEITDVAADGLVGEWNKKPTGIGRNPGVKAKDRLMSVNGIFSEAMMISLLGDQNVEKLVLNFSRDAANSAPGLWQAEIERNPGEGWGMELQEPSDKSRRDSTGALCIAGITANLAIDRWNQQNAAAGNPQWPIEPGDMIVAVEPEVRYSKMLEKLKKDVKVRVMLLRWHAGPAPEAPAPTTSAPDRQAPAGPDVYEVVLTRRTGDKLGLRLEPSPRNPARTMVAEVLVGGLVEAHNMRAAHDAAVTPGDEVESINGEADSSRFAACCQSETIVIRLLRRAISASPPAATTSTPAPAPAAPAAPPAATPETVASAAPPAPSQNSNSNAAAATLASAGTMVPPTATTQPPVQTLTQPPVQTLLPDAGANNPQLPSVPTMQTATPAPAPAAAPVAATPARATAPSAPTVAASPTATVAPVSVPTPSGASEGPKEDDRQTPQPALQRTASAADAKEAFLLKAEIEQLKRRLQSDSSGEELKQLRKERDELRLENEELQRTVKLEQQRRRSASSVDAAEQQRSKALAEEALGLKAQVKELSLERSSLAAEVADWRARAGREEERRLEERRNAEQRARELEDSNARLQAQLDSETCGRGGLREPIEASVQGGSTQMAQMAQMRGICESMSELQELSQRIHRVLQTEAAPAG